MATTTSTRTLLRHSRPAMAVCLLRTTLTSGSRHIATLAASNAAKVSVVAGDRLTAEFGNEIGSASTLARVRNVESRGAVAMQVRGTTRAVVLRPAFGIEMRRALRTTRNAAQATLHTTTNTTNTNTSTTNTSTTNTNTNTNTNTTTNTTTTKQHDKSSNMSSYPISFPSDKPVMRLERLDSKEPVIYVLRFLGAETPDNRLTVHFLEQLMAALEHVEQEWDQSDSQKAGAALITTGETTEKSKFYSNGLDFEAAIGTPGFFDKYLNPVYEKLLSFPIPTIASMGGHCFAAGFGLVMAHDYRIMNGRRGFASMNEIFFGAQVPPGLYATLNSKQLPLAVMRKMILEGHRFGATEAKQERIVDLIAPAADATEGGPQITLDASISLAKTIGKFAGADAYQSNKLVMHAPFIAILREKNEDVCARL